MYKRLALAALLALVLLVGAIPAQAAQTVADPITQIDTYFGTMVENDMFSGSVLIAREGEVLLNKGYGMAIREWEIPNAPDTKFYIGELTMQFTAMGVVKLQEQGLLTFQDPVCMYIEECPDAWSAITIEHLLTLASGIPEFTKLPDYDETSTQMSRPLEIVQRLLDEPLAFSPGDSWTYGSSSYLVLGSIIAEVSGQTYQAFLRENFFEPLGMANTGYDATGTQILTHRAEGYASPTRRTDYIHNSAAFSAAGLYSTVEDLYQWEQALFGGQVVSQESWDTIMAALVAVPGSTEYEYGFGLFSWLTKGLSGISHGNIWHGFSSQMSYFPDDRVTIVILSNREDATPFSLALCANILFGQ